MGFRAASLASRLHGVCVGKLFFTPFTALRLQEHFRWAEIVSVFLSLPLAFSDRVWASGFGALPLCSTLSGVSFSSDAECIVQKQ
eukprot:2423221-Amphidinium_carterae.1